MRKWYESMFENYAENYDKESFVQGTPGEVDFIENEINHDKKIRILDIGCGTGRHSVELAKRGYIVTGIDISEAQLKKAWEKAQQSGVHVSFQLMDARDIIFRNEFDLAIMICEGAFPLMETDEMNYKILEGAANSLKHGGKLIFTTLNALYALYHNVNDIVNENSTGNVIALETNFDLMTFRDTNTFEITDDSGKKYQLTSNERYYAPSEISWLLQSLGFGNIHIGAARLGAFSREDLLTKDDFEMLVVAVKE